jgi:hypothetical protein
MRAGADRWPLLYEAGREHVRSQHGPENFRRLEGLYERVIHQQRAGESDRPACRAATPGPRPAGMNPAARHSDPETLLTIEPRNRGI